MSQQISNGEAGRLLTCSALLAADETLGALSSKMHSEYEAGGDKWPRDWMQNHVNDRAALNRVRMLLLNRVEAANL